MNTPKHSIIVPVYNTGDAISSCIESVLNQTYSNFELIIIDDGSSDKTPFIIDKYASKDCRIKAVHISNGGVSNARNVGLDMALGEYVMFIDSDDWIEKDYLEQIENRLDDHSDIYILGITQDFQFDDGTLSHSKVQVSPIHQIIKSENIAANFGYLKLTVNLASACLKTYSRSMLQKYNIRFDSRMIILEDYCFVLKCLQAKPQITLLPYIGYHYRLPVQLNILKRRGNRDLYPSISLALDALNQFNQNMGLKDHSYRVFLQNAQDLISYVLMQSKVAPFLQKPKYFVSIAKDSFFVRYCDELMLNGGGRFRLLCLLMKVHLFRFAYLAYRYL